MGNNAGVFKEYDRAFCLDEGKLRKICDVLRTHGDKLSFKTRLLFFVEREDDSFYETNSVDEVLADDNAQGKEIQKFHVSLRREVVEGDDLLKGDERPSLSLIFFDRIPRRYNEVRVGMKVQHEDRDWCFLLADELSAQVERLFIGSWLVRMVLLRRFTLVAVVMTALCGMFFFLASPHGRIFNSVELGQMTAEEGIRLLVTRTQENWLLARCLPLAACGLFAGMALSVSDGFDAWLKRLGGAVFYWGDARAAYDRRQRTASMIKWGIIVALVVGFLASLAANLLTSKP